MNQNNKRLQPPVDTDNILCKCKKPCLFRVKNTTGQGYYTCEERAMNFSYNIPKNELPGCDFFCWEHENIPKHENKRQRQCDLKDNFRVINIDFSELKNDLTVNFSKKYQSLFNELNKETENNDQKDMSEIEKLKCEIKDLENKINTIVLILKSLINTDFPNMVTSLYLLEEKK